MSPESGKRTCAQGAVKHVAKTAACPRRHAIAPSYVIERVNSGFLIGILSENGACMSVDER